MSGAHDTEQVQRRILLAVLALNALLFVGLGVGGLAADSSALLANAVDNGSDAAVYLISFLAVGRALIWKTRAAQVSGVMLLIFAVLVLLDALRRTLTGTEPVGPTMMVLAVVAADKRDSFAKDAPLLVVSDVLEGLIALASRPEGAGMVAAADFPDLAAPTSPRRGAPRASDGLIRIDVDGLLAANHVERDAVGACDLRNGGDIAALTGVCKALIAMDDEAAARGEAHATDRGKLLEETVDDAGFSIKAAAANKESRRVLDHDFIEVLLHAAKALKVAFHDGLRFPSRDAQLLG